MSQLQLQLEKDLLQGQKERDEVKVSTLRLMLAAIHNAQIQKGKEKLLTDGEIEAEIAKEVKRHGESIEAFEKANRQDLAAREKQELEILQNYLPKPLSAAEITKIVAETISKTGARKPDDFGKIMAAVMGKVAGKADGKTVGEIVKNKLSV